MSVCQCCTDSGFCDRSARTRLSLSGVWLSLSEVGPPPRIAVGLVAPGTVARLKRYYDEHPEGNDLLQGPLLYDDLGTLATLTAKKIEATMLAKVKQLPLTVVLPGAASYVVHTAVKSDVTAMQTSKSMFSKTLDLLR